MPNSVAGLFLLDAHLFCMLTSPVCPPLLYAHLSCMSTSPVLYVHLDRYFPLFILPFWPVRQACLICALSVPKICLIWWWKLWETWGSFWNPTPPHGLSFSGSAFLHNNILHSSTVYEICLFCCRTRVGSVPSQGCLETARWQRF